jgi:hypothetical protein
MKLVFTLLFGVLAGSAPALAENVPLPLPRPAIPTQPAEPSSFAEAVAGLDLNPAAMSAKPTPCDGRLAAMAAFEPMPRLIGPGACGGSDMVLLDAVILPDKGRVSIEPPSLLRCEMAESLAAWLRDEVAPRIAKLGSPLRGVQNYDSYECRDRNRIKEAKLSEHAKGNAIDVRAFRLADGRRIEPVDVKVDKPLREALRESACHRFTTVLGPGEPYHEGHIHLDILERHNGYRICQWDVRDAAPPPAETQTSPVPLPLPRPSAAGAAVKHSRNL